MLGRPGLRKATKPGQPFRDMSKEGMLQPLPCLVMRRRRPCWDSTAMIAYRSSGRCSR